VDTGYAGILGVSIDRSIGRRTGRNGRIISMVGFMSVVYLAEFKVADLEFLEYSRTNAGASVASRLFSSSSLIAGLGILIFFDPDCCNTIAENICH
jgi:hypothetical protein